MNDPQKTPNQSTEGTNAPLEPANEPNFLGADAARDSRSSESIKSDQSDEVKKDRSNTREQSPPHVQEEKSTISPDQLPAGESNQLNIPLGLRTSGQVSDAVRLLLDAPVDLPDRDDAIEGLWLALKSLDLEFPDVKYMVRAIEKFNVTNAPPVTSVKSVRGLSRRKGLHRLYVLAREVGHAHDVGKTQDPILLRIFGCHCLRSLLSGYEPIGGSIAKLRSALFESTDQPSTWQPAARSRALIAAKKGFAAVVQANPLAASQYGLLVIANKPQKELSPVEIFNQAFRRRTENLIDFATKDAVAGAGGYDTLSAAGLRHSGQAILARVETGDPSALVIALEIVTHLPSETLLQIPIIRAGCTSGTALAWIEIESGEYCYVLYHLIERGAKVPDGSERLYEEATQIVRKKLSPSIFHLLQTLDQRGGQVATNLGGITGADAGHHPRSAVVEGSGYKVTARRLQESLPALMLQEGMHRWPVALSTNSHFLLTRGRRQYGACRSADIHKVVCRECALLDWPQPDATLETRLIGAPTVATRSAVRQSLNFFSDGADKHSGIWDSCDEVIHGLNAHAQWISAFAAFSLAMRRWLVYQIQLDVDRQGSCAHFNDKDVHEFGGPGVPVVTLLREVLMAWAEMCRTAIQKLNEISDARSVVLANQINAKLRNDCSFTVFTVDAVDRIQPVGYKTWHDLLPVNIRLLPNFSRQFWPLHLADNGVVQLTLDILMRHQFEGFSPGSTYSSQKLARSMSTLLKAMNSVVDSLELQVPMMLKGDIGDAE